MKTIELTTKRFFKNPNTKTTYILESTEVEMIDEETHDKMTCKNTLQWFRRLGGSETTEIGYAHGNGLKVIKLISSSPCKGLKTVRTFNFNL